MTSVALQQGQSVSAETHGADPQAVRVNKLEILERFADDLAHEIKNPLHSMVINLEVLKRRIQREGGSPPDELMRYAGVLGSELERVNRRIELLLRLVRPERTTDLTSLPQAVIELVELLELERDRRRIRIDFEPESTPIRPHVARDAARQIVLNLLLHALSTIPSGGRLMLETRVESGRIVLRMEGSGDRGRVADIQNHNHDDFADLSVARALLESCGGRLTVGDIEAPLLITASLPLASS